MSSLRISFSFEIPFLSALDARRFIDSFGIARPMLPALAAPDAPDAPDALFDDALALVQAEALPAVYPPIFKPSALSSSSAPTPDDIDDLPDDLDDLPPTPANALVRVGPYYPVRISTPSMGVQRANASTLLKAICAIARSAGADFSRVPPRPVGLHPDEPDFEPNEVRFIWRNPRTNKAGGKIRMDVLQNKGVGWRYGAANPCIGWLAHRPAPLSLSPSSSPSLSSSRVA